MHHQRQRVRESAEEDQLTRIGLAVNLAEVVDLPVDVEAGRLSGAAATVLCT